MYRGLTVLFLCFLLTGCLGGTTQFIDTKVDGPKLRVMDPNPVIMQDIEWIILSKSNINDYIDDIKSGNLTIIGMDPNDYENMSINIMQILNYIQSQKNVIAAYREYYEPQITK